MKSFLFAVLVWAVLRLESLKARLDAKPESPPEPPAEFGPEFPEGDWFLIVEHPRYGPIAWLKGIPSAGPIFRSHRGYGLYEYDGRPKLANPFA